MFNAEEEQGAVHVPAANLGKDLAFLLGSERGADVTLLCGEMRVRAHSLILSARSPVFQALLTGELAVRLDAVPVPDEIDAPTLRRMLSFIYTDECEPASAEEAQHLLNAADHYGLIRLQAICERKLVKLLSVKNAAYTLTLADQHGATTLKNAALRFVAKNADVLHTDGWQHLKQAAPGLIEEALHTAITGEPPKTPDDDALLGVPCIFDAGK
jgi:speckle-type POZ protein